jgi:hypothetical protein
MSNTIVTNNTVPTPNVIQQAGGGARNVLDLDKAIPASGTFTKLDSITIFSLGIRSSITYQEDMTMKE